jgi:hypothetical protein
MISIRLEKLCKATLQACTETDIHREANKAYEGDKEKENGCKKILSKARVLSVRQEEECKVKEPCRRAYEEAVRSSRRRGFLTFAYHSKPQESR